MKPIFTNTQGEKEMGRLGNPLDLIFSYNIYDTDVNGITLL